MGAERHRLEGGKFAYKAGQAAHHLYVLVSGEIEVRVHSDGNEDVLDTMKPGCVFGEKAILEQRELRSRSLFAKNTCEVLKIERSAFEAALHEINPHVPNEQDSSKAHELRVMAYMELLAPSVKRSFKKGEHVYKQGERASPCLYIVKSGQFAMIRKEKGQIEMKVDTVHENECFGAERLLDRDPYSKKTTSIQCVTPQAELLVIQAIDFHRLCDHSIVIGPYISDLIHQRKQNMATSQSAQASRRAMRTSGVF